MAQPTTYEREFNFSNQQAETPSEPLPAPHVDAEFNRIKLTTDEILENLSLIQNDSGELIVDDITIPDGSIGYDQLTAELQAAIASGTAGLPVALAEAYPGDTDTERWQAAIDALATTGGTITTASKTIALTNLDVTTSSITLDFNGATVAADPTTSGADGAPMIYAHGSVGAEHTITGSTKGAVAITATGNGAAYAAGDYVIVGDAEAVAAWNDTISGGPVAGYGGSYEVNRILSKASDVLTLAAPLERTYATTPTVKKMTPIENFRVTGIGSLTESNPGAAFTGEIGDLATAPHLIAIEYAVQPRVDHFHAGFWNLHMAYFKYCWQPAVSNLQGISPYRPSTGGHGYMTRFDRCRVASVELCYGYKVRHVVDDVQSIDTHSERNISLSSVSGAYAVHGHGAVRFLSDHDTAYGTDYGWIVGNPSFAGDYDTVIRSPRGHGHVSHVAFWCKSERLTIIDLQGPCSSRSIMMCAGAKGLKVQGGRLENMAAMVNGIRVRSKLNTGDSYGIDCENVEIDGTQFPVTATFGGGFYHPIEIDALGTILVKNWEISATANFSEGVKICETLTATNVVVSGGHVKGAGTGRAVKIYTAPTDEYRIIDNVADTARDISMAPNGKLVLMGNDLQSGGTFTFNTTTAVAAVAAGALMRYNTPSAGAATARETSLMLDTLYTKDIILGGLAGVARGFTLGTIADADRYDQTTARFITVINATAESGGNVGSDLACTTRADDGSQIAQWLFVKRSSGDVTMNAGRFTLSGARLTPIATANGFLWQNATNKKWYTKTGGTAPSSDTDGQQFQEWVGVPASAAATGRAGDMAYASGFLYVCVATDTWQRVAIATW